MATGDSTWSSRVQREIVERHAAGWSPAALAEHYGGSRWQVTLFLRSRGAYDRDAWRRRSSGLHRHTSEVLWMHARGHSARSIARRYGVSASTVSRLVRREGRPTCAMIEAIQPSALAMLADRIGCVQAAKVVGVRPSTLRRRLDSHGLRVFGAAQADTESDVACGVRAGQLWIPRRRSSAFSGSTSARNVVRVLDPEGEPVVEYRTDTRGRRRLQYAAAPSFSAWIKATRASCA